MPGQQGTRSLTSRSLVLGHLEQLKGGQSSAAPREHANRGQRGVSPVAIGGTFGGKWPRRYTGQGDEILTSVLVKGWLLKQNLSNGSGRTWLQDKKISPHIKLVNDRV